MDGILFDTNLLSANIIFSRAITCLPMRMGAEITRVGTHSALGALLSPSRTTNWSGLPYKLERTGLSWRLLLFSKQEVKAGPEAFQEDKLSLLFGSCQTDPLERGEHYVAEQTAAEEERKQNQADRRPIFIKSYLNALIKSRLLHRG